MRRAEIDARRGVPGAHISLKQSNESFLAGSTGTLDAAPPLLPHDRLHELVAYGERPAFEALKRDPTQAYMDAELFKAAPLDVQLRCVLSHYLYFMCVFRLFCYQF